MTFAQYVEARLQGSHIQPDGRRVIPIGESQQHEEESNMEEFEKWITEILENEHDRIPLSLEDEDEQPCERRFGDISDESDEKLTDVKTPTFNMNSGATKFEIDGLMEEPFIAGFEDNES